MSIRHDSDDVRRFIHSVLVDHSGLEAPWLSESDRTLSDVLWASERLHNSVDLMECFAKIANGLKARYQSSVRLRAFPLDTPLSVVVDSLLRQVLDPTP
jgi:hypothetical protein